MNKPKRIGTAGETAVVKTLQADGYVHVERRALTGSQDRGDIAGIPGVVIEVKNHKAMSLAQWVEEAKQERLNDGAEIGVVWHRRVGKGDPKDWYVSMDGHNFLRLLAHFTGMQS